MRWATCATAFLVCACAGWVGAQPSVRPASATAIRDGRTLLDARPLGMPLNGVSAASLRDTFNEGRPGHTHEAIDILAPRGTPVYAVDDGPLMKLFTSVCGLKLLMTDQELKALSAPMTVSFFNGKLTAL